MGILLYSLETQEPKIYLSSPTFKEDFIHYVKQVSKNKDDIYLSNSEGLIPINMKQGIYRNFADLQYYFYKVNLIEKAQKQKYYINLFPADFNCSLLFDTIPCHRCIEFLFINDNTITNFNVKTFNVLKDMINAFHIGSLMDLYTKQLQIYK